jgi:3-deoxy-D-manno-octulosonate 8-phosphate phosphatase (KDO 8-P phosphatase)
MQELFESIGGKFLISPEQFWEKLGGIRAFLFDWDGVFNSGKKGKDIHSGFSEPDAMGLNMLRFSYWLGYQKQIPICGILSGIDNPHAAYFAQREKLPHALMGYLDKGEAFNGFLSRTGLKASEVAFVFDDVLDLPVAKACGLRIAVNRKASPLFIKYLKDHSLVDYLTGTEGGEHAVREACELMAGFSGLYEKAVSERAAFTPAYHEYLTQRNEVATVVNKPSV